MVEPNDIPTGQNVENMLFEVLGLVFHSESFHLVNRMQQLPGLCNSPVQLSLVLNARHLSLMCWISLHLQWQLPSRACVSCRFLCNI